ncbi:NACHT domain-containing NTPase [Arthrobacter sp. GMC3]|uniref:NACHT domain-containing protein n=1 Tax=Arthrobacter sp. GMC3 TaxID=2058894 RepID=UPI0021589CE2|nr:HNH endonuclease [Arthrobacter sp. GMC3]
MQALTVEVEDAESGASGVTVVGQEAHIRAQSVGGPRFNPKYADVDGYENLILLCPTHHTLVDANDGAGYTVKTLIEMKTTHERNQGRREALDATLRSYIGDRYAAENSVQFQQVELRGPSVESMFVDVPVGCRRDGSAVASLLETISVSSPGDTEELTRASGLVITGATQALLHPDWVGNAVLVGGPGQGKSTLLQYVCQFHRARRLGKSEYSAGDSDLARSKSTPRFPIRIDLRKYAQWAAGSTSTSTPKKGKKTKAVSNDGEDWRSLEEFLIEDIHRHVGANDFTPQHFVLLLATEPVLLALDGLDEVANLPTRARVVQEIIQMYGRLSADAADLVILVATRPGTSLQPLTSSGSFPLLHLQRLTPGLRLQYLSQWCAVSALASEAAEKLKLTFMDSQHIPHISELASYPMQLAILLHLLYRRRLLPQQRTELYEEYLKTFLDREQTEDKEPLLAEKRRVIEDTHAYLGWYLQAKAEKGKSSGSITRDELRELLRHYLVGRPKQQELADELYSAITDRVLCLVERDDAFEFEVQSLREYFASLHIFDNLTPKGNGNSRDDALNALLERPYWANVCRFFIGKLSTGEVRGLGSNLQAVEKKIAPHPQIRAMAVTALNDRIYEGLTSAEIRVVVDFIFGGPGAALAEDGVLDPAGSPLWLTEQAGRAQAVEHLEARLEGERASVLRDIVGRSLLAHAGAEDRLTEWWWAKFEPTGAWLRTAAQLACLRNLNAEQTVQLETVLASVTDPRTWSTDLLLTSGYDSANEAIEHAVLACLNDGSAEIFEPHAALTNIEVLAACASSILEGPYTSPPNIAPLRVSATISQTTGRIERAVHPTLTDSAGPPARSDWNGYLGSVAEAWGDGWVLRRAVSMLPSSIALSSIASGATSAALSAAARSEADYRDNKSNPTWWRKHFDSIDDKRGQMLSVLALLELARTSVIVDLATVLDSVVLGFDAKRFRVMERALKRDAASRRIRLLDLHEELRLRKVKLSGRVLWLIWIIANESTRDRLPIHLEAGLQDIFQAGVLDGRTVLAATLSNKKRKLEIFRGTRDVFPLGGWLDQTQISSMSQAAAKLVLQHPGDWPPDIVQMAVDRLGTLAETRTPPLADIAVRNHWFLH